MHVVIEPGDELHVRLEDAGEAQTVFTVNYDQSSGVAIVRTCAPDEDGERRWSEIYRHVPTKTGRPTPIDFASVTSAEAASRQSNVEFAHPPGMPRLKVTHHTPGADIDFADIERRVVNHTVTAAQLALRKDAENAKGELTMEVYREHVETVLWALDLTWGEKNKIEQPSAGLAVEGVAEEALADPRMMVRLRALDGNGDINGPVVFEGEIKPLPEGAPATASGTLGVPAYIEYGGRTFQWVGEGPTFDSGGYIEYDQICVHRIELDQRPRKRVPPSGGSGVKPPPAFKISSHAYSGSRHVCRVCGRGPEEHERVE